MVHAFETFWGLLGYAVFFFWLMQRLYRPLFEKRWHKQPSTIGIDVAYKYSLKIAIIHIMYLTVFIFSSVFLAYWARSLFSNLSVVSTLLAISLCFNVLKPSRPHIHTFMTALITVSSIILYASFFGFSRIDVYSFGYPYIGLANTLQTPYIILVSALAALAIILSYFRSTKMLYVLIGALLSYGIGVLPSTNLWDALLDPFLAIYATFSLIKKAYCKGKAKIFSR